jgi:hypothetical protein
MRKHRVLLVLTALEVFALALSALFWFVMRPDLLRTYALDGIKIGPAGASGPGDGRAEALGAATRIALSGWFIPLAAFGGILAVLLALFPHRTKTRTYLASGGLVWTVFGLAFAIWYAYAPAFERMGP